MRPERQSPPAANRGAKSVVAGDALIVPLTGCICGCVPDEPCITERPAPPERTCWACAGLPVDQLERGRGCCPEHSVKGAA